MAPTAIPTTPNEPRTSATATEPPHHQLNENESDRANHHRVADRMTDLDQEVDGRLEELSVRERVERAEEERLRRELSGRDVAVGDPDLRRRVHL